MEAMQTPADPARPAERLIRVSAVVLRRADGRVLSVRKRGTARFMFPGGKPESGESPVQAAVREVAEETGLVVAPAELVGLGAFEAPAANESGFRVRGDVFVLDRPLREDEHPQPAEEIAEAIWLEPARGRRRVPEGYGLAAMLEQVLDAL